MYAAYDIRRPICDGEFFFQPSQFSVDIHLNSLVIRFFSLPDRKNRCRKSDVGYRKSESDTCKQPNINEKKGKDRCRKSAVGCRKQHTCVRTLRYDHHVLPLSWIN